MLFVKQEEGGREAVTAAKKRVERRARLLLTSLPDWSKKHGS